LPDEVVTHTREKYMEAFRLLTGIEGLNKIDGMAVSAKV
jgi:hypothetical protein